MQRKTTPKKNKLLYMETSMNCQVTSPPPVPPPKRALLSGRQVFGPSELQRKKARPLGRRISTFLELGLF